MGYTTTFEGQFRLDRELDANHAAYLRAFSETRRMKRDRDVTEQLEDGIRHAVGLPVGVDGGYFVAASGYAGQGRDAGVVDFNQPPRGQPELWCKWVPTHDGCGIEWSGAEKFYDYVAWLNYIIEHFLEPWGYTLNGVVAFQGEEHGDCGAISVVDNVVTRTYDNDAQ